VEGENGGRRGEQHEGGRRSGIKFVVPVCRYFSEKGRS
jgi:hypothetical protein